MIDLDANATTALDPRVLHAMTPHLLRGGNPESRHDLGRHARKAWDDARESIAANLGAWPDELILTSGGTESNNMALLGLLANSSQTSSIGTQPSNALLSTIEHPAVAEPLAYLEKNNKLKLIHAPVTIHGTADIPAWENFLLSDPAPTLATLMLANNETGAIQPVAHLATIAASRKIPFHTDAVQAVGRVPVHFHNLGVTTLSAGSHKMHGPPGIGILLVRRGTRIAPLLRGGGQQLGLRPGTPPVALAVGLAEALKLWSLEHSQRLALWNRLQHDFLNILNQSLANSPVRIHQNGPIDPENKLPQTLNIWFDHPAVTGEVLLMQLDMAGLALSLGSACASGSTKPSPVLLAMGLPPHRAKSSIRISFSAMTSTEDASAAAQIIASTVRNLASQSPEDQSAIDTIELFPFGSKARKSGKSL